MEKIIQHDLYVTKATLDSEGRMVWAATASDTNPDSHQEQMSLSLYKSFIDYINKGFNLPIYISLAHYPRLDGVGEAGVATEIYVDGNKLKAKGYFHDTRLGRSIYNAIRKDRRDNVPAEKRVRISIGFFDRKHTHENGAVWEFKSGKPCIQCSLGVGGKTYLEGILEHLAVTRVPVNKRTDIIAKSEGEDMTTRYEDALSIVGDETIVDEVEKAYREKVNRAETEKLIEKGDSSVDVAEVLRQYSKEKLLALFSKLTEDGKVTTDEISDLVNNVLNEMTEQSEAVEKAETPKENEEELAPEKEENKEEKSETEVEKMEGSYSPYGGAKSIGDAKNWIDAARLESNVYYAYSIFGAVAQNILADTEAPVENKLSEMTKLLNEFKDYLKPEKLKEFSEAETEEMNKDDLLGAIKEIVKPIEDRLNALESKSETDVEERTASVPETEVKEETPAWKSVVVEFESGLSQALGNTGEARAAALQEVINKAGENLLQLHNSLAESETPQETKELSETVVTKAIDEKLAPIQGQISTLSATVTELVKLIQSQNVGKAVNEKSVAKPEIPVSKSIVLPIGVPKAPEPMSIMDIATKTTFGR